MRVYEEYDTPAEKRRAQRGARRGKPTGKARAYVLVFPEHGTYFSGGHSCMEALATVFDTEPGAKAGPVATTGYCLERLRHNCRRIARRHLPPDWARVFHLERQLRPRGGRNWHLHVRC